MERSVMTSLGNKLRTFREERRLSIKALAQKLDVTPTQLLDWEEDRMEPSIEHLAKLCDCLEVSADRLLETEVSSHNHTTLWSQNKYFRFFIVFFLGSMLILLYVYLINTFHVGISWQVVMGTYASFNHIPLDGKLLIPPIIIMILGFTVSVYFCYKYEITRIKNKQRR